MLCYVALLMLFLCMGGCTERPPIKGETYDILQDTSVLKGDITIYKRPIAVWSSPTAAQEGKILIETGIARQKPDTLDPYLSCIVSAFTPAVHKQGTVWSQAMTAFTAKPMREIRITQGPEVGCHGFVAHREWRASY